jgi:hypothetical protein
VARRGFTLLESGRRITLRPALLTALGMGTHLSLVVSAVVISSLEFRRAAEMEPDLPRPVYLAPERQPVTYAVQERLSEIALTTSEPGDGPPAPIETGSAVAEGNEPVEDVSAPMPATEEFVLTEIEVDSAVIPDPESGGPSYPPQLLALNIEGQVLARFVVDTFGRAEPKSFMALQSTHPEFSEAVRASLPLMKFRPARLKGAAVSQLVVQSFAFRITEPAPPDTAGKPIPEP